MGVLGYHQLLMFQHFQLVVSCHLLLVTAKEFLLLPTLKVPIPKQLMGNSGLVAIASASGSGETTYNKCTSVSGLNRVNMVLIRNKIRCATSGTQCIRC